ncbi:hypothetical protein [Streptomyces sp. NPDC008092]|uniref:hypothetical protein n=1 Tax=Streptomyces sp. NPDC008092 TaxID=3364808 RepID=UPI0036ECCDB4
MPTTPDGLPYPADFLRGASTAAHQIEATDADGDSAWKDSGSAFASLLVGYRAALRMGHETELNAF